MTRSATDHPSSLASSCVHWTTLSKTDQTTFHPLCPRLIKPQSAHFVQDWSNHNPPTLSKTDQTTIHYPMHFLRVVLPPTLVTQPLKPFWRERWNTRYCFPAKGKMHEWCGVNRHARIGAKRTDIIELMIGNSAVLFWQTPSRPSRVLASHNPSCNCGITSLAVSSRPKHGPKAYSCEQNKPMSISVSRKTLSHWVKQNDYPDHAAACAGRINLKKKKKKKTSHIHNN